MKRIKYLLTAVLLMFISSVVVNASESTDIYTDSTNVRWQYRYDNADIENGLEISFYDKPDDVTSVTIPTLQEVKDANSSIARGITKYVLVNYFAVSGKTPNVMNTNITNIDFSNITIINGVKPMINSNIETTITFANSGTIIGEEITYTDETKKDAIGVFEDTKLKVNNLDKVVSIGNEAFKNVTFNSQNITLSSLEVILDGAFQGTNIITVDINSPIIGNAAFKECYYLEKAIIGNEVDELQAEVFMNDANLSVINFNNITKIGNYAFSGCTLFNIDLYNTNLNSIGDAAFMDTIGYTRDLKIPDGVTQINWKTFYNTGTSSVNLNNVTEVKAEAFSECRNLKDVEFGKTEHVDYRSFYNDKKITDLTLGDNLYYVGTQAFSDCSISNLDLNKIERIDYEGFARNQLTELYLPKTFTYQTESNLFTENQIVKATVAYDTTSSNNREEFRVMLGSNYDILTDLIVLAPYGEDEEVNYDHAKFDTYRLPYCSIYNCYLNTTEEQNMGNASNNVIRGNYFYDLPALVNLTIGEGYEFIGGQAFFTRTPYENSSWRPLNKDDYKLTNIKLPETLKGIGAMAFYGNLVNDNVNINLPQSLELIGAQAFYYCPGFKNAVDLKNLQYIGLNAFMYSGITEMYFRDKLTFIGPQTIFGCPDLKIIVFDCDFYAINDANDNNFFSHINNGNQYELIEFTEKVQTEPQKIRQYDTGMTFMYRLKAKKLLMADCGWKHLGISFLQEAEIDYLTLPKNLEEIGNQAFLSAVIKNDVLEMPDTVKSIGISAFHSAKLTIDQLPESLTTIGETAFYNCDFNSDPVIPSGVTSIGKSAFNSIDDNIIHRNSFTINANLPATVTNDQTIRQLMYNTTVDYLYFGPEVVELPTHTLDDTEFYQMPVKKVVFEGLEYLPSRAFLECTELESVDFSKDTNLKGIGNLAFYQANKLNEIKFNNNPENEINLGEEAFRYTAFTSIGQKDSGFDLTSNKFMLDGKYTFSNIASLKEVYVPNNFNDNVINEYTFWDCKNLERADIDYNIASIKSYAFAGDSSLDKIFLWGDPEVIQEDDNTIEDSIKDIKFVNEATYDFDLILNDSLSGETTINNSDFTLEDEINIYNYPNNGTTTYSFSYPYYINIEINESVIIDEEEQNYIIVTIKDLDPSMFTIPSNTDIYTYSTYDAKSWDEEYELFRRNELFNTNSTYYPLDEVLYLTTNKPEITVKNDDDDFDKSDLIVYALRRDGIILESDTWQEYTTHFARTNNNISFEKYDSSTTDKEKIVYDTIIPEDIVDVSTENFASMTYEFIPKPGLISRREVLLNYVDKPTSKDVDTDLQPVLTVENVFTGSNLLHILTLLVIGIVCFIIALRILKPKKRYNC